MYGKAKVGRPDWYMMGACIVFALTFSLRSVPLAVLLLLFMPFSLLSLTGELPLPTRNAPICQTLLCISIPLLVIGAFSSLLLLLPKLLIPSACVWLFGGALMLFLPPGAFRKSRMAMYWAVICFAAVVALLIMLLQRYQAYGDLYEGLSYDILRVMMNARTAAKRGLKDGDRIEIVSFSGGKTEGAVRTTQMIHPDVLGIAGAYRPKSRNMNPAVDKGVAFGELLKLSEEYMNPLKVSLDRDTKVKIRKL